MAPKVAIPLFEKAINSSDPTVRRVAIISAALCYHTLKDYQKAEQYLLKQAQQGDAFAQNMLGMVYEDLKEYQKAIRCFTKAAEQGSYGALCYDMGEGVPEDAKMAVKWYTKAAEKGHKDAMYSLAVCYEKGTGVPKDMQKAREWINKLSAKGDGRAKIWLEKH